MGDDLPGGSVRDAAVDAGTDGGLDGGSGFCDETVARGGELGGQCRGAEMVCNSGLSCLFEQTFRVGGPNDPIVDFPGGEEQSFDSVFFPGDYCSIPLVTTIGTCTANEEAACNAQCGFCAPFFADADICLRACVPTATDNSACRDGYKCDLLQSVCDVECTLDEDCLVFRDDTNDNGMFDPYDPDAGTGDRLVYDTESTAFCNLSTYRCEHPGTPGARGGDPCADDEECEPNGECLTQEVFDFPGGYCTKFRCDLEGNACANGGRCQSRGFGLPVCTEGCKVGAGATAGQPETYLNNTQGCREDYTCGWDGINDQTVAINGACVPGVYNDQTVNNIGEACETNAECYSPFGQGGCVPGFGCTVFDCGPAVPGIPADECGEGNACVILTASLALCLRECTAAEQCLPGQACGDIDGDPGTADSACLPVCFDSGECRAGEVCTVDNECVPTG